MSNQTLGEKRVRTTFNPSDDSLVADIKMKSAELINCCDSMRDVDSITLFSDKDRVNDYIEYHRLLTIAQDHYETATMYAVKAATFFPDDINPFKK